MVFLESFHFIRPYALVLLFPMVILALRHRTRIVTTPWEPIFDPVLLKACIAHSNSRFQKFWRWIGWGTVVLCVIALSGPTWKKVPTPLLELRAGRVILLDLSQSMLAQDLKPDRLTRAKQKIQDFLHLVKEGQVALVGFAAEPFVISPLTPDLENIASQLSVLTPELMPQQGTSITKALLKAQALFKQSAIQEGQIILLTDSIEEDDLSTAQRMLSAGGHFLSIIGVGTEMGAPIPKQGGGFFQQGNELVVSTLTRDKLKQLATNTSYEDISLNDDDLKAILLAFKSKVLLQESDLKRETWYDAGPLLLLMVLPFVAFIFRRGFLVLFLCCLSPIEESYAIDWWQRPDQKAYHQTLKGVEAYDAKAFEQAKEHFANPQDAIGYYNLGNTLARLGDYSAAIEAYEEALKREPTLKDAAYNRDLLKAEMKPPSESKKSTAPEQSADDNSSEKSSRSASSENTGEQFSDQSDDSSEPERDEMNQPHSENESEQVPQKPLSENSPQTQMLDEFSQHDLTEQHSNEMLPELKRVPDDPGGLWRRKFLYQYQKQYPNEPQSGRPW
ncbi:MAG: VWA domain-containing protein [Gammaproteobacteria bacterium]